MNAMDMTRMKAADATPRIAILRDLDAIRAIEPAWRVLEARSHPAALFQCYDQTLIWARSFAPTPDARQLLVLVLEEAGQPLIILPLMLERHLGLRVARLTGSPVAQYGEVIGSAAATDARCAAIIAALRREQVDALRLEGVRAGSFLSALALQFDVTGSNTREAPFADLDPAQDHDAFVRARSKGLGKKLRARKRQLEERGTVEFAVLEPGAKARGAMESAVHLKREWLAQRGAVSTAFLDPLTHSWLLETAELAPGAMVLTLCLNGTIAAIRLGFARNGTFFSYLSAYDEKLADYSPGRLLMDFTFSFMRRSRFERIDLLPPGSDNKALWCDASVSVADYALPLTLKGRMHTRLYQQGLRPMLRKAYYAMPAPLRRGLARQLLSRPEGTEART